MIGVRVIRRGILGVVAVCAVIGLSGQTPALAAAPWWHVESISRPANLQPGVEGQIVVIAVNRGDADADGSKEQVTITDKLPSGVQALSIQGAADDESHPVECSLGTLKCTSAATVRPYRQIRVVIGVMPRAGARSGEVNEASVSGGEGARKSFAQQLKVGGAQSFGVERYELTPEEEGGAIDTQAGSHPFQLTTTLMLNQTPQDKASGGMVKDLRFKLPPGLIGNPSPFPQCTLSQFFTFSGSIGNQCSATTVLGVARVTVNEFGTLISPVFNLEPSVGEPARFGFMFPGTPVMLDTSVRTGGDYGVTVRVDNIPQMVDFLSSQVTFWGVPGDPRHDISRGSGCLSQGACTQTEGHNPPPFLALPGSCGAPLQSVVEADAWAQPGVFQFFDLGARPLALDGCERLPFTPTISVVPDGQAGSTPTGLTVGVHVPQDVSLNPTGLAEADVKDTTVALPVGMALNPAAADGLQACAEEQVALSVDVLAGCPEASKVATVEIKSPLLPNPLTGEAYLATQNANPFGSLVALYLVARDPVSGILIKVAGEVKLDPVTGQLVSTFKNTPQLPFEDLKLHFFGGSRAPLSTPASCGRYATTAAIAPWSGNGPAEPTSEFQIVSGPNGRPCANPLPFAPSLTAGSPNIQAGAFSPFTMTMSREDGNQSLKAVRLHMPPGLAGALSSVQLCEERQANAGTCGPDSLVGETIVSVGLGSDPFSVRGGKVYITGPYHGAPFGLSIVNPAKAGPYDLGQVIVRAKIDVDPVTAALTVTTDSSGPYAIPQIIDGIPLQIKHVNVNVNRAGFTFNPTNCNPMAITSTIESVEGASSAVSVPFQVTNCANLKLAPKFSVSTSGHTSKANGASLTAKVVEPAGAMGTQANLTKVKVDLPVQLPSRLTTLQNACRDKVFESNPAGCPPQSIIGHAKVITPLLPVPLIGPAYFVSHGGEAFPSLTIVLQGYGVTVELVGTTFISKSGITSTTFRTVPDVPFNTFELTLPQGKYSALGANLPAKAKGSFCGQKLVMPTLFAAQNGLEIHQNTPIAVTGCAKAKALTRKQRLAAALNACRKKHNHDKRVACAREAHRKYGAIKRRS
jgi:hypothetical protein